METGSALANLRLKLGPLVLGDSVLTTWLVMAVLAFAAWWATRGAPGRPGSARLLAEAVVAAMKGAVADVLPENVELVFPLIATMWIFIFAASMAGVVPGLASPTADISVTSALAVVTFLSVHWFGIRASGLKAYLRHYLSPSPLMLPFHVISEISRTAALAIRLFGNIMSLEFAAYLILFIAGLLVPIPIIMLHIVEAVIQSYIFGMLALVYIGSGIQVQRLSQEKAAKED